MSGDGVLLRDQLVEALREHGLPEHAASVSWATDHSRLEREAHGQTLVLVYWPGMEATRRLVERNAALLVDVLQDITDPDRGAVSLKAELA